MVKHLRDHVMRHGEVYFNYKFNRWVRVVERNHFYHLYYRIDDVVTDDVVWG